MMPAHHPEIGSNRRGRDAWDERQVSRLHWCAGPRRNAGHGRGRNSPVCRRSDTLQSSRESTAERVRSATCERPRRRGYASRHPEIAWRPSRPRPWAGPVWTGQRSLRSTRALR